MRTTGHHGAFTLIEVLVSVLILALGLLGLGAVFPVVIAQQRAASDAASGEAVLDAAEAYLRSRTEINRLVLDGRPPDPMVVGERAGWGLWLLNPQWSPDLDGGPDRFITEWEPWEETEGSPPKDRMTVDVLDGTYYFPYRTARRPYVSIPVGDRLWPGSSSPGTRPLFVWDIAGRRSAPVVDLSPLRRADANDVGYLQLAIFVRRIDTGIRVPRGATLRQVLTGDGVNVQEPRVAVGIDSQTGEPTGNGLGIHAGPMTVEVVFDARYRDRFEIDDTDELTWRLARQIDQRLVDNLGNVFRVVGIDEEFPGIVVVEPEVPGWVREDDLRQVVFMPQVPAAVRVIDVVVKTPEDPL